MSHTLPEISSLLDKGLVGVLPSDTIYGLFASTKHPQAIEKIYQLKERDTKKPLIVHISSLDDLVLFNIEISEKTKRFLEKVWPNQVSVIFPSSDPNLTYLHRGTETIAFRLIDHPVLTPILKETGPLVGTSVNKEGYDYATTIKQAQEEFNDQIDFYYDHGTIDSPPSTVVSIAGDSIKILRQGSKQLDLEKLD